MVSGSPVGAPGSVGLVGLLGLFGLLGLLGLPATGPGFEVGPPPPPPPPPQPPSMPNAHATISTRIAFIVVVLRRLPPLAIALPCARDTAPAKGLCRARRT